MMMVRSSTDRINHMKPKRHRERIHPWDSAAYFRGSDMRRMFLVLAIGLASPALGADPSVSQVLGSIDIAADRTVGDVSTVNGAIEIGPHASVAAVATVNGHLRLGAGAKADSMTTVNGSVTLEPAAQVKGAVTTVNGHLELAPGADVGGDLGNVNVTSPSMAHTSRAGSGPQPDRSRRFTGPALTGASSLTMRSTLGGAYSDRVGRGLSSVRARSSVAHSNSIAK
jgi:hypothetical protein